MRHDITPALVGAFIRRAFSLGYEVRKMEGEDNQKLCLAAFLGEQRICSFEHSGAMRFSKDNPLERERQELHSLLLSMKQAHDLYADAPPLKLDGLEKFHLVASFGDCLLAARMDKSGEVRFVTWEYTYDHTGVTTGHYYETDYEGAKQDFATRARLIPKSRIFSKEEMEALHYACVFCGREDGTLTFEDEKRLREVMEKLEENLPELAEGVGRRWEQEEEYGM